MPGHGCIWELLDKASISTMGSEGGVSSSVDHVLWQRTSAKQFMLRTRVRVNCEGGRDVRAEDVGGM